MPTTKDRVQVTLPAEISVVVHKTAKRDRVSCSEKILHYLKLGLELEEDVYYSAIADERMKMKGKAYIPFEDVWQL